MLLYMYNYFDSMTRHIGFQIPFLGLCPLSGDQTTLLIHWSMFIIHTMLQGVWFQCLSVWYGDQLTKSSSRVQVCDDSVSVNPIVFCHFWHCVFLFYFRVKINWKYTPKPHAHTSCLQWLFNVRSRVVLTQCVTSVVPAVSGTGWLAVCVFCTFYFKS